MDLLSFANMTGGFTVDYQTQELEDDYEDYGAWIYSEDDFLAGFYCVKEETDHGVILTKSAKKVLTSSLSTVFLPVVYIIIFIVGFPANAMAIWVFLFRKKKNPASILMTNLALADLLFIIWLPLKISYHFKGNNWTFGEPLCKVLVGFFYGNMYCSTIFIAVISMQRYWAVAHPLSQKLTNQVAVCISVGVWLVVWLTTIPLYLYDQTVEVEQLNIMTCHDVIRPSQLKFSFSYFLTMFVVGYVVPGVVCTVSYTLMFRSLNGSRIESSTSKRKKKATILTITVLVMFLVCFTPSNIMMVVYYSLLSALLQNNTFGFYITILCLSSLNSCLDPFLYYFISSDFREHVKNALKGRSERSIKRMQINFRRLEVSSESPPPSTS